MTTNNTTATNQELFNMPRDAANREAIAKANIGLVYATAMRHSTPRNREEAISLGMMGLAQAIDTFDPTKEVQFSTFAVRCITNSIFSEFRKSNNQTKRVKALHLRTPKSSLLTTNEQQQRQAICVPLLLDRANLDERQRRVIECRFGIGCERMTLAATAAAMEMSVARVQQIEKEALAVLRSTVNN